MLNNKEQEIKSILLEENLKIFEHKNKSLKKTIVIISIIFMTLLFFLFYLNGTKDNLNTVKENNKQKIEIENKKNIIKVKEEQKLIFLKTKEKQEVAKENNKKINSEIINKKNRHTLDVIIDEHIKILEKIVNFMIILIFISLPLSFITKMKKNKSDK